MAYTVTACGNSQNAGAATSKVQTVTVTLAVGETGYAAFAFKNNTGSEVVSFSDSAGNTWTADAQINAAAGNVGIAIGSARILTQLTAASGTVTGSTGAASTGGQCISVIKVDSGSVAQPFVLDGTNTATSGASSVTTLAVSVTPTFNPDFGIYGIAKAANGGFAPSAGWTEMSDAAAGTTLALEFGALTALTASNTTLTPSPTFTSTTAKIAMALYQGIGSGTPAANSLALLGVG